VKREDFQNLAAIRLKEARVLLKSGCWEGAYYLGGYAAECALKACIAKQTARHDFPDKARTNASYTHDLEELLRLAKLAPAALETLNRSAAEGQLERRDSLGGE
jgi:HEPN domain-containing protein